MFRFRCFVYSYLKINSRLMADEIHSKKYPGHWNMGLLASMDDPDLRIASDERIVIIKDKYPKAKFHFLVLPREKIPSLKSLGGKHVSLLQHMHQKGEEIAQQANKELKFRLGYHAVPSMSHLHLHVISQDFNSPCLKNKKHWNSFNTEYFIDSTEIIRQLEQIGCVKLDGQNLNELLKSELKCHVCGRTFSTMPALKSHIVLHNVTKSARK